PGSALFQLMIVSAGWSNRRDNFAVVRRRLHRQEISFAVAYDIEGNAHADRQRFRVGAGLLFSHYNVGAWSVTATCTRFRPTAVRIRQEADVGIRIVRRRAIGIGWGLVIGPSIIRGVSVRVAIARIAVCRIAVTWVGVVVVTRIGVGIVNLRG